MKPSIVVEAERYIGQREIPGLKSNPWVVALWYNAASWLANGKPADDSTVPWCGAFVRFVVMLCGWKPPAKWWSARSWLSWGVPVDFPCVGAVAIYDRPGEGAHVTIIAGQRSDGALMGIGGNQGDAVSLAPFPRSRVAIGYRLPPGSVVPALAILPVIAQAGAAATSPTREA